MEACVGLRDVSGMAGDIQRNPFVDGITSLNHLAMENPFIFKSQRKSICYLECLWRLHARKKCD